MSTSIRKLVSLGVTLTLIVFLNIVSGQEMDVEVERVSNSEEGVLSVGVEENQNEESNDDEETAAETDEEDVESEAADSDDGELNAYGDDTAKQGHSYEHHKRVEKKKVFFPVFVPEKEKKKMKIISVDKGFYIQGGTQIFGKFLSLKHCMKACATDPTCFQGDYNPWLHKCYKHTNYTACGKEKAHPQFVHFSKVPCTVVDAPRGHITLGASMGNGIEAKGVDSLQQCIKKCVNAGRGIPLTVATTGAEFAFQACFAIDYDFATHKCFVFGANFLQNALYTIHCSVGSTTGSSQGTFPNPTVVHITFCPNRGTGR